NLKRKYVLFNFKRANFKEFNSDPSEKVTSSTSTGIFNVLQIFKYSENIPKGASVVTIFPDSAFRYITTIFDQEWLFSKGLKAE
ncbi:MAG: hypothetical protein N2445_08080, partial [Acidobacteria bacterium]|nr:hypothetical protein [Acidobacteriota bacterium]